MDIINFKGQNDSELYCGVDIVKAKGKTIVMITELPEMKTSISAYFEELATNIFRKQILSGDVIWIKHHQEQGEYPESWDLVKMYFDGQKAEFTSPKWARICSYPDVKEYLSRFDHIYEPDTFRSQNPEKFLEYIVFQVPLLNGMFVQPSDSQNIVKCKCGSLMASLNKGSSVKCSKCGEVIQN